MNLLLDLLYPTSSSCPAIASQTLLVLVTALLANPAGTRTFESLDGLLTVTSLFKQGGTSREVKIRVMEFLYFYLMPEEPGGWSTANDGGSEGMIWEDENKANSVTRSMRDKQRLLARHLNNVEDLVDDLMQTAPFGAVLD